MKINIKFNEKEFEKSLIKEMARQILVNEYNESGVMAGDWNNPVRDILIGKARKVLKQDKEFDEKIQNEMRKQLKNKKLIKSIAEEILKDRITELE